MSSCYLSTNIIESVHSIGRVLGDRRVLYKYLNPNLVAIALEGVDTKKNCIVNQFWIIQYLTVNHQNYAYSSLWKYFSLKIKLYFIYSYYGILVFTTAFISVHLLDTVMGQMVYQTQHSRASGPIHLVLSEHFVVVRDYSSPSSCKWICIM